MEKRLPAMLRMYLQVSASTCAKRRSSSIPRCTIRTADWKSAWTAMTCVENLFVAGEAVGGIHGRNRLMGNSLLDMIVFGRNAGQQAGAKFKERAAGRAQPRACAQV